MLADKNIDAIYNPLPNHLHVPWSIRALKANKHVLCEKPIGLSVAEAEQLAGVAAAHPKLKIMEAFMVRHHPQWQMARELVRDGRIGQLRTIDTAFSYFNDDPDQHPQPARHRRRRADGHRLLPDHHLALHLRRRAAAASSARSSATPSSAPTASPPRCSNSSKAPRPSPSRRSSRPISGPTSSAPSGRIEIEIPFNAPNDRPTRLWIQTGPPPDVKIEEITFETCDHYTIQADVFARAILDDTPVPTPIADAVANMRVIERVRTSADTNAWT